MRGVLSVLSPFLLSGCIVVAAPPAQNGEGSAVASTETTVGSSNSALPPARPPDIVPARSLRSVSYNGETVIAVGTVHMGDTNDYFVQRVGEDGWSETQGGQGEERCMAGALASDDSVVVVGGTSSDTAGEWDAFVARYEPGGALAWQHNLGSTGLDYGYDIATTGDRIYVVGTTRGALPGQTFSGSSFDVPYPAASDAFLAAYNLAGERLWIRQFGTREDAEGRIGVEEGRAVAIGTDGAIYVVGMTSGALFGQRSFGIGGEAYVAKFRPNGERAWARLLGRRSEARDVVATENGVVVVGASSVFDEGSFVAAYNSAGRKQWEHWVRPSGGDAIEEGVSVAQMGERTLVLTQRGHARDDQVHREGIRIYQASEQGLERIADGGSAAWHLAPDRGRMIVVGQREGTSAMWRLEGNVISVHELGE